MVWALPVRVDRTRPPWLPGQEPGLGWAPAGPRLPAPVGRRRPAPRRSAWAARPRVPWGWCGPRRQRPVWHRVPVPGWRAVCVPALAPHPLRRPGLVRRLAAVSALRSLPPLPFLLGPRTTVGLGRWVVPPLRPLQAVPARCGVMDRRPGVRWGREGPRAAGRGVLGGPRPSPAPGEGCAHPPLLPQKRRLWAWARWATAATGGRPARQPPAPAEPANGAVQHGGRWMCRCETG